MKQMADAVLIDFRGSREMALDSAQQPFQLLEAASRFIGHRGRSARAQWNATTQR